MTTTGTVDAAAVDDTAIDKFLLDLIAARSYSTHEADTAAVLRRELERLGFSVDVDEIGNVLGTLTFGEGPTVLIDCHMDTVVVADPGKWTRDPAGEIVDGRIYGRGTVDMKGPMAACVHGVASLRNLEVGRVVISGSVAEELAEGPSLARIARRIKPDYVVIGEATARKVAAGQRGRAEVLVEVSGTSSHSAHPQAGLNAAEVMADIIRALRTVPVPNDPILGDGILVLTDVMSHPYPGLSVIPERCVATYDRRTLVGETEEDVLAPVRQVIHDVTERWGATGSVGIAIDHYTAYTGTEVQVPNFAPAWIAADDSLIVRSALRGLRTAGLDPVIGHYKFCTNGSATAGQLGIPTIGYGPGEEDQAHTVDESIARADLYQGARGYAAIVSALLTQNGRA